MPTPGEHTFLSDHDSAKLDAYVRDLALGCPYRHTLAEDREAAIREHIQEHCCWYRVGVGTLVGAAGFDPEARLRGSR